MNPDRTMIDFIYVEQAVKELKQQLVSGKLDEKTFEDRLLEMIDIAEDGHYWMFGHKSEQWFRHDGEKWVPENPYSRLARAARVKLYPQEPLPGSNDGQWSHRPETADGNPGWGWFVASLILLAVIGVIVYNSTMALYG